MPRTRGSAMTEAAEEVEEMLGAAEVVAVAEAEAAAGITPQGRRADPALEPGRTGRWWVLASHIGSTACARFFWRRRPGWRRRIRLMQERPWRSSSASGARSSNREPQ